MYVLSQDCPESSKASSLEKNITDNPMMHLTFVPSYRPKKGSEQKLKELA